MYLEQLVLVGEDVQVVVEVRRVCTSGNCNLCCKIERLEVSSLFETPPHVVQFTAVSLQQS